jgi:hypothetical protein
MLLLVWAEVSKNAVSLASQIDPWTVEEENIAFLENPDPALFLRCHKLSFAFDRTFRLSPAFAAHLLDYLRYDYCCDSLTTRTGARA